MTDPDTILARIAAREEQARASTPHGDPEEWTEALGSLWADEGVNDTPTEVLRPYPLNGWEPQVLALIAANDPAAVLAACARDRTLLHLAVEGIGEHRRSHCEERGACYTPCPDIGRYQRILDSLADAYPKKSS